MLTAEQEKELNDKIKLAWKALEKIAVDQNQLAVFSKALQAYQTAVNNLAEKTSNVFLQSKQYATYQFQLSKAFALHAETLQKINQEKYLKEIIYNYRIAIKEFEKIANNFQNDLPLAQYELGGYYVGFAENILRDSENNLKLLEDSSRLVAADENLAYRVDAPRNIKNLPTIMNKLGDAIAAMNNALAIPDYSKQKWILDKNLEQNGKIPLQNQLKHCFLLLNAYMAENPSYKLNNFTSVLDIIENFKKSDQEFWGVQNLEAILKAIKATPNISKKADATNTLFLSIEPTHRDINEGSPGTPNSSSSSPNPKVEQKPRKRR